MPFGTPGRTSDAGYRGRHHEHVYPLSDGEGVAGGPISVSTDADDETNVAATAQWYYGEPSVILPVNTITIPIGIMGCYIYGNIVGKEITGWCYQIFYDTVTKRNVGNAWDEGATVLTVTSADEAAKFQVNDLVVIWSPGYKPNGEILKVTDVTGAVVTVARETSQFGGANTGLRWNHTTNDPGDEQMALIYRPSDQDTHPYEMEFGTPTVNYMTRYDFMLKKIHAALNGTLCRLVNQTDAVTVTIDAKMIF